LFRLTWSEIDLREGIIELRNGRAKTGKPQAVPIFTPELKALISELQAERRRVPNLDGLVLTMDGQPIDKLKFEYHFRAARKAAKIKNFTFHNLRHCCITRWAAAGLPTAAAMLTGGHSSVASHKRYQNLTKADLKAPSNCSQRVHRKKQSRKNQRQVSEMMASPTGFEPESTKNGDEAEEPDVIDISKLKNVGE